MEMSVQAFLNYRAALYKCMDQIAAAKKEAQQQAVERKQQRKAARRK
jgi:hypothetical protein